MQLEDRVMSIIKGALKNLCKIAGKQIYTPNDLDLKPDWLVASYDDKDDFAYLWSDDFLNWVKTETKRNLVIVWDGMPDSDDSAVNVLDHITPVDWALTLSHRLLQESDKPIPELRILIFDSCQTDYPSSAFSVRMLPAICQGMPWLRIYRTDELENHYGRSYECLFEDIKNFDPSFHALAMSGKELVASFVYAWSGSVAESGSHHDISNLLGPLVLSTSFNDPCWQLNLLQGKPARQALLNKMRWLSDIAVEGKVDNWFDFARQRVGDADKVSLVLIDDQANHGWLDIVLAAVGAKKIVGSGEVKSNSIELFGEHPNVDVFASTSYEAIKDKLDANIGDQRFKLSLTGTKNEILLLDLRLFFDKGLEIEYFEWAIGIARILKEKIAGALLAVDCDTLSTWLASAKSTESINWRKTKEHLELLTLLPRILATIDMSLPIVIFSSTGQRQVAELLKPYGNIITVFEKPRFFGYVSAEIARETQTKFSLALASAMKMLQARKACIDLLNVPNPHVSPIQGQKHNHVEIYIDEDHPDDKDMSKIYVGGCVAIFAGEGKEDALKKADQFDDDMVSAGARYFDGLGIGKKPLRIKKKKDSLVRELILALQGDNKPIFLGVVRLLRQRLKSDDIAGDMTADNHYRRTLGILLEVFLCEVLPQIIGNGYSKNNCSISIFVGTRVKFYSDNARAFFEESKSRFGLDGFSSQQGNRKNYFLTSMDRGGVFSIISDLYEFRHPKIEVERAIGVTLCYHKPSNIRDYPLNFICRNCKNVVSYNRKDVRTTESSDVKASELPNNVAKIMLLNNERGFGFIQPLGAEKVFCSRSDWTDFSSAKINGWIIYNSIQSTRDGLKAFGVRPVDEGTLNKIKNALMISILSSQPTCRCGNSDFVPDYRALHFLADEALDKFPSEPNSPYDMLKIIFDDNLDEQLESLVEAGRELDNGNTVSAVIKAIKACGRALPDKGAGCYMLSRIPAVLNDIPPKKYWELAQQL